MIKLQPFHSPVSNGTTKNFVGKFSYYYGLVFRIDSGGLASGEWFMVH